MSAHPEYCCYCADGSCEGEHCSCAEDYDDDWADPLVIPNGIGPICQYCHKLIDWHPVDHTLGCPTQR